MKKVLTIAGSDCSGGAGIQADLKTMCAFNVYGMSAITALTAQNTQGVAAIMDVSPEFLGKQLDSIFNDIYPDAIKIGMVSNVTTIKLIAQKLQQYPCDNVVVDPVMVATSGAKLIADDALSCLKEMLFPLAKIITPNIPEAQILSGLTIKTKADALEAAKKISTWYPGYILIKGGHFEDCADDLLFHPEITMWFENKRINNPNTHGTGCTLSSAIASNLAIGFNVKQSVANAKAYVAGALKDGLDLGKGRGPLNHCWSKNNK